ncbi:alpha/beta fold hydrolase [Halalkalirubrum salinum]|uniref:alpha/beta fold hydrolase n=1 Tax=Halalkalirubrum salinum TaxID=2563889 RepID=UPI0010FB291E|nr:alpha/beta hydrolase [Halalkalirubrum salinum]
MKRVTHHGRETAYRVFDRGADGATVLFIHGSGGTSGIWKSQHRLADEHRIVTLDLSGHAKSDDVNSDPGYETLSAYVDDVIAVAEATDTDTVVGHSMGGAVALQAVLNRDLTPDRLGLVGTGARLAVLEDLLAWLETDFDRAIEFLHKPDRLFHDPDPRLVELSLAAIDDVGQSVTARDFQTCHSFDVRDSIDEITVPTLAIVGEHDKLTPRRYHEYLADELPDCRLAIVEDAAHLAMLEQPQAFNAALSSFLSAAD